MIVLDTNVLSEPLRRKPDPSVMSWLAQERTSFFVTAISVGDLLTGARRLPSGRRRTGLIAAIESTLATFAQQILPYDERAARRYAELQVDRRRAGRPLSAEDGMIAAICAVHGATLATRNARDFEGLGIPLADPWRSTPA